jgi:hypothetical protein
VVVVVVALFAFSTSTSAPAQISYGGHVYGTMVAVDEIEVAAHVGTLKAVHASIDGKPVFVSPGAPPHVVALQLSPGHYDAYQLSG